MDLEGDDHVASVAVEPAERMRADEAGADGAGADELDDEPVDGPAGETGDEPDGGESDAPLEAEID
jgi:hypothetical protein